MKKLSITFILIGFTLFGFGQDSSKIASIKTLLEITGSGKLGVQVIENMFASYKQSFPNVPEEFWDNFIKEANPEALTKLIIPIYDKQYTKDEINQMIEFYQSALGKKLISKMPQIMQESMDVGRSWGKEIGEKVYSSLQDKGYIKDKQ